MVATMGIPAKNIKKSIIKHRGILSAVARELGISRTQVHRRINSNQSLKDATNEARATLVDDAESALVKAIKAREAWAVSLTLKTIGKDRGYVERSELEVDGSITVNVVKFGDNDTK